MTTLTKKKILDSLKDKETRELFAEEHISTGLPFQIHGLREKLGLTQAELARRAGMAQERISVLEDPNYEFVPKIPTLIKLANVFDVPLIVKFGSWSELFNWETNLSPEMLAPKTFEEEIDELERTTSLATYTLPVGKYVVQEAVPVGTFEDLSSLFATRESRTVTVANPPYYSTVTTIEELERQGLISWVPLQRGTEGTEPIEATVPTPLTALSTPTRRNNVTDFPDQKAA